MSRPLRINTDTTPVSLKEIANSDLEYVAATIAGSLLSSTAGTLTGELNINGASGTIIGDFTDTSRVDAVGTHPVGTSVNSVTSTFKQVLDPVTDNTVAHALKYDDGLGGLKQDVLSTGGELFNAVISLIDYKLQTAAPSESGTWTAIGNISDTLIDGTVTTSTLWKRTASAAPAPTGYFRPLKENGGSLKELSDAELQAYLPNIQNAIVNTGIGQYRYQETAPVGGTWIAAGQAGPGDTIHALGDIAYTGYYSQAYTGFYSQAYTGYYSQAYSLTYARNFSRNFGRYYSGYLRANYTGTYTGYYTGYFSRAFTGYYSQAYTGYYSQAYTGYYTGQTVLAPTGVVSNPKTLWKRIA